MNLPNGRLLPFSVGGGVKYAGITFLPSLFPMATTVVRVPKCAATHRILAILLDDIEILRDRFMGKLREVPKVSGGFRSVVGTGAWQKLKETAAV